MWRTSCEVCFSHASPLQQRLPSVIVEVRPNCTAEPVCEDSARFHPELTSPGPLLILFAVVIFEELDELGRQSGTKLGAMPRPPGFRRSGP